jgi:hypothetical protein
MALMVMEVAKRWRIMSSNLERRKRKQNGLKAKV